MCLMDGSMIIHCSIWTTLTQWSTTLLSILSTSHFSIRIFSPFLSHKYVQQHPIILGVPVGFLLYCSWDGVYRFYSQSQKAKNSHTAIKQLRKLQLVRDGHYGAGSGVACLHVSQQAHALPEKTFQVLGGPFCDRPPGAGANIICSIVCIMVSIIVCSIYIEQVM